MKPLIFLFPKYMKWEPALVSFYLFAVASAIASLSTPLTNTLNALGKIKITLSLMTMWTLLTWALTWTLVYLMGYNGVALSLLLITSTILLVIHLVKKVVNFSFIRTVRTALLAAAGQGLLYGALLWLPLSHPLLGLMAAAILGLLAYVGIVILLDREKVQTLLRAFAPVLLSWQH